MSNFRPVLTGSPPTFSTRSFTFNNKTFSADASDLGHKFLGPLYNDAADVGMVLKNPATGNEVPFVFTKTESREGDVLWWEAEVLPDVARRIPRLTGLKVKIFND